jgi:hypothetical protein
MKLPIQAQPVTRKVSTAKIFGSMLLQPLSLLCSKEGGMCGGISDGSCCPGLDCAIKPGASYGHCINYLSPPIMIPVP